MDLKLQSQDREESSSSSNSRTTIQNGKYPSQSLDNHPVLQEAVRQSHDQYAADGSDEDQQIKADIAEAKRASQISRKESATDATGQGWSGLKALREQIKERKRLQEEQEAAEQAQLKTEIKKQKRDKESGQDSSSDDDSDELEEYYEEDATGSRTSKSSVATSQPRKARSDGLNQSSINEVDKAQLTENPNFADKNQPIKRLRTDDFSESGFSQLPAIEKTSRSTLQETLMQHQSIGMNRRLSQYAELYENDIVDPFLRACYTGNLIALKDLMSGLNTEINGLDEDVKTKNRLGFYLALLNQQVKTANYCLNQDDNLKMVVIRVAQGYDQSNISSSQLNMSNNNLLIQNRTLNDSSTFPNQFSNQKDASAHFGQSNESNRHLLNEKSQGSNITANFINRGTTIRDQSDNKAGKTIDDDSMSDGGSPPFSLAAQLLKARRQSNTGSMGGRSGHSNRRESSALRRFSLGGMSGSFMGFGAYNNQFDVNEHLDSEINFRTSQDMGRMKHVLQSACSVVFNTNMIKIALNLKEDRVAAVILAQCPVIIDETTLNFAIQSQSFNFVRNLFIFEKTDVHVYQEQLPSDGVTPNAQYDGFREGQQEELQIKQFTVDELLTKVCDFFEKKECEKICFMIMSWKCEPRGNILELLCQRGLERVATHFMNAYPMLGDEEFFLSCITEDRQLFLKNALFDQFFDLDFMHNQRALRWIVDRIVSGNNILFALNLLLYANFRKWPHDLLKDFTKAASLIISNQLERNILLISYNPIMALGLTIQFLNRLKSDFNEFDMESHKLVEKFQVLGHLIIENMQFDHVEEIFMERDFLDRTVLNIITENKIMPFIVINKLHFLINKIWDGKESDLIDGKVQHFSRTKYLLNHEMKRLRGVNISIRDILGYNFKPNIHDYNFVFQLKFRMQSVLIIFQKDFICAFLIVCMFQYINYSYLNLFTERKYKHTDVYEEKLAIIRSNLIEYKQFNFIGTILSISYFINFICRIVYNHYNKKKIPFDLWLYFDLTAGVINIIAFNIVGGSSPESILNTMTKRAYDYYMILVLMISWFRFFSYFLVISHVSKITLTLFMMLRETVFFMVILGCYLMLMTTVFATLFRDTETDDAIHDYHSVFTTMRALVDYFLANFPVKDLGSYQLSHSVLYIIHVTISNIFLLNFLVAILQTVFDIMIQNGDFYATQYQYIFITKYMKAMENSEDGYDKLILFPPPLNIFLVPLVLVSPSRTLTRKLGRFISYFFFWGENVLLVICFFAYLVLHDPLIVFKTLYQILTKIDGLSYKLTYSLGWLITGFPYLLYVNFIDTVMLCKILCLVNSVIFVHGEEERNKNEAFTFYVNRNVIRAIKTLKEIGDKSQVVFHKRQNLQRMQTQKMSLRDKLKNQQNEMRNEDIYIVRKEYIIAVYEEISSHDPYVQRHRMQQVLLNHANNENNFRAPTSGSNQNKAAGENSLSTSQTNMALMMKQAMANTRMHSVKNQYGEVDPQISPELRGIISKLMLSKNRDNIGELVEYMLKEKEKNYFQITEEEASEVDSFISKFTILQQNQETMTIDLDHVSRGFPRQTSKQSIKKIQLLNFQRMQRILISFFNDDQDEMFNYYDNRMTRRLDILRDSTQRNSTHLDRILEVTKDVFNYIFFKEHIGRLSSIRRNTTFLADNISSISGIADGQTAVARRGSTLMQQVTKMYNENFPKRQETLKRQGTIKEFIRQGTLGKASGIATANTQINPHSTSTMMQPGIQSQGIDQPGSGAISKSQSPQRDDDSRSVLDVELDKNKSLMKQIHEKYQKNQLQSQGDAFQAVPIVPLVNGVNKSSMTSVSNRDAPVIFINPNDSLLQNNPSEPQQRSQSLTISSTQAKPEEKPSLFQPQSCKSKEPGKGEDSPSLEALTNIDIILDLDFETKKAQQKINLLRQKRELLLKQEQLKAMQKEESKLSPLPISESSNNKLIPPRPTMHVEIKDIDSSLINTSVDLSTSNQPNTVHRQRKTSLQSNTNIKPNNSPTRQPRLSILHTFIQQPTITGATQIEKPQSLHNYMTAIMKQGTQQELDEQSSQNVIEVPLTAEQILEQIRAQRRERSHEDGSNYSNTEVQEFSAADFSSFITTIAHKKTLIQQQTTLVNSSGNKGSSGGGGGAGGSGIGSKNKSAKRINSKQVSNISRGTIPNPKGTISSFFPGVSQKRASNPTGIQEKRTGQRPSTSKRESELLQKKQPLDSFKSDSESEQVLSNPNVKPSDSNNKIKTIKEMPDEHD